MKRAHRRQAALRVGNRAHVHHEEAQHGRGPRRRLLHAPVPAGRARLARGGGGSDLNVVSDESLVACRVSSLAGLCGNGHA